MSEAKSNAPVRYQVALAHKPAPEAKPPHEVTFRLQPACHCKLLELELEPGVELEQVRIDHAVLTFEQATQLVLCPPPQRPGRLLELLVKGEPKGKNPALWGSLFVLSGLGPPYPSATRVDAPPPEPAEVFRGPLEPTKGKPATKPAAPPPAPPPRAVVDVGRPPPLTAEQIAAAAAAQRARAAAGVKPTPAAPVVTVTSSTEPPLQQPAQQQVPAEGADPFGTPDWLAAELAAESAKGGGR